MRKTLIKHGNSYALVIDKPILELLQVTPDTPLELTTNGDCLVVTGERIKSNSGAVASANISIIVAPTTSPAPTTPSSVGAPRTWIGRSQTTWHRCEFPRRSWRTGSGRRSKRSSPMKRRAAAVSRCY